MKLSDFSTNALRLDKVRDAERRERLRRRYAPVAAMFRDYLMQLEPSHPLFAQRETLLQRRAEAFGGEA